MMKRNSLKNWLLVLASAASLAGAVGCGKGLETLEQDPLAHESDPIKNGQPPEKSRTEESPKGLSKDDLRTETLDFLSFKEGVEGEATVTGRVLYPINGHTPVLNQDFEITVKNLKDFPGATYDKTTGVFKWKPAPGFVESGYTRNAKLVVVISTVSPIIERTDEYPVWVSRQEVDPEIVKVEGFPSSGFIREGESPEFIVRVKDPSAEDKDNARPRLLALAGPSGKNLSNYIVQVASTAARPNPSQDPTDKSIWIFRMKADLSNAEVTSNDERFNFNLMAVSRFGNSSAPLSSGINVRTSVRKPMWSWADPIQVVTNLNNVANFTVFDPQGEGSLQATFRDCSRLPGGNAKCSCVNQQGSSALACTIAWTVPTSVWTGDEFTVTIDVTNKSRIWGDSATATQTFYGKLRATNNGPLPTPTPSATPVPTPEPLGRREGGAQ